jgi:hypothetical protein
VPQDAVQHRTTLDAPIAHNRPNRGRQAHLIRQRSVVQVHLGPASKYRLTIGTAHLAMSGDEAAALLRAAGATVSAAPEIYRELGVSSRGEAVNRTSQLGSL